MLFKHGGQSQITTLPFHFCDNPMKLELLDSPPSQLQDLRHRELRQLAGSLGYKSVGPGFILITKSKLLSAAPVCLESQPSLKTGFCPIPCRIPGAHDHTERLISSVTKEAGVHMPWFTALFRLVSTMT